MINQKVMAQQLKKARCEVNVASHGADALLFLEKTTFAKDCGPYATPLSIVLMDLEMPVMDGLTCIRKIRDWQKSGKLTTPVPVIAVSQDSYIPFCASISQTHTTCNSGDGKRTQRADINSTRGWHGKILHSSCPPLPVV